MPNIISCLIIFFFVIFICLPKYMYRDIVDAAHLKPLSRHDKMNSQTNKSRWNSQIWIMFVFSHATVFVFFFSVAIQISGECEKANKLPVKRQCPIVPFLMTKPCLMSHFYSFANLLGYFVVSIRFFLRVRRGSIINWQIN